MEKKMQVQVVAYNANTKQRKNFVMNIDHEIDRNKAMEQGWTHISAFIARDKVSIGMALALKGWVNGGVVRTGDTRYWLPLQETELEVVPF